MLVVNRFRLPEGASEDAFRADLTTAHATLAGCAGYLGGEIGRNLDDPALWVLTTRWESIGGYRRALSSYDVKLSAVPTLSRALDEPSAYEVVTPDAVLNVAASRG